LIKSDYVNEKSTNLTHSAMVSRFNTILALITRVYELVLTLHV